MFLVLLTEDSLAVQRDEGGRGRKITLRFAVTMSLFRMAVINDRDQIQLLLSTLVRIHPHALARNHGDSNGLVTQYLGSVTHTLFCQAEVEAAQQLHEMRHHA